MKKIFAISLFMLNFFILIVSASAFDSDAEFDDASVIVLTKPVLNQSIRLFSYNYKDDTSTSFGSLEIASVNDLDPYPQSNSKFSLFSTQEDTQEKLYEITLQNPGRENVIAACDYLNTLPNVKLAEPNYIITLSDTYPNDEYYASNSYSSTNGQYNLRNINAPNVWNFDIDATNTIVAVLDSGIQLNHEDLASNIWLNMGEYGENGELSNNGIDDDNNGYIDDIHGWDFYGDGNGNTDNDVSDENGHGTHVSGIISAVTNNRFGVASLARNVKLMPLKIFGPSNDGKSSYILGAIKYAQRKGVKLVNNSYGGSSIATNVKTLINLYDDMLFICASGNSSKNVDIYPEYPACLDYENVLSVASVDINDTLASSSNWGQKSVDVAAPGVAICSTYTNSRYGELGGTSMACPLVTSSAALLKTIYPDMTVPEIIEKINTSADTIPNLQVKSGGRINAYNMLLRETSFDKDKIVMLNAGDTQTLTPQLIPQNLAAPAEWASDNENVATVENGIVTAIGDGKCNISLTHGPVSGAVCEVTVDTKDPVGTITYNPDTPTTETVTATLSVSEEIEETEMTHTFTENGSYTFKFKDKAGREGSATATVDWIMTSLPTPSPSPSPTPSPSPSPTPSPSPSPTPSPSPSPTPSPSPSPTPSPSPSPTPSPSPSPTPSPSPSPTPSPSPSPVLTDRVDFVRQENTVHGTIVFEKSAAPPVTDMQLYIAYKRNNLLVKIEEVNIDYRNIKFDIDERFSDCEISAYLWNKNMTPLVSVQEVP